MTEPTPAIGDPSTIAEPEAAVAEPASTTDDAEEADATTMRVHEDRLTSPAPRIEMTPSEAVHLGREGRRPHR